MTRLGQLSEDEVDDRFRITGPMAVLFSLGAYAHQREQFTVHFNDGRESFLTYPLSTNPETGELIVDCSGSPEVNARFLRSPRNIFVARPDGITVQFATGQARQVEFDGDAAFALPLPSHIVRLQRREYFRITAPRAKPLILTMRLEEEGESFSHPLHDLSVAGCGLGAGAIPDYLSVGQSLANCRFVLPDVSRTLISGRAMVRHLTPLPGNPGADQCRIGLQFVDLEKAMEHRIQRYIVQVEHDRRQLAK